MPFKSQAQRRKFAEMMVKGEISPETFEEWNRETGSAKLPERVAPKKRVKSSSAAKKKPSSGRKKTPAARRKKSSASSRKSARKRRT